MSPDTHSTLDRTNARRCGWELGPIEQLFHANQASARPST